MAALRELFLALICAQIALQIDIELLTNVLDTFQMRNPIIVDESSTLKTEYVKKLFLQGHYVRVVHNISQILMHSVTSNILHLDSNLSNSHEEYISQESSFTLVIVSDSIESIIKKIKCSIDMEVYFVDQQTKEAFESYEINDVQVKTKLGRFDEKTKNFQWEKDIEKEFMKRRSDFHGIELTAMTEASGLINIDPAYKQDLNFHKKKKDAYLVTDFVSGLYHEILLELEKKLNFTTSIYKRKDGGWGFVYPSVNGSFTATGMVGDLFFKRADLVVATLTIMLRRALYIDYLLPLTKEDVGLYIQSGNVESGFNFQLYTTPFR